MAAWVAGVGGTCKLRRGGQAQGERAGARAGTTEERGGQAEGVVFPLTHPTPPAVYCINQHLMPMCLWL